MQHLIDSLKAIAEPTRLRIVSLCAGGELAVSEIAQILGQSQPRVSRHHPGPHQTALVGQGSPSDHGVQRRDSVRDERGELAAVCERGDDVYDLCIMLVERLEAGGCVGLLPSSVRLTAVHRPGILQLAAWLRPSSP